MVIRKCLPRARDISNRFIVGYKTNPDSAIEQLRVDLAKERVEVKRRVIERILAKLPEVLL